MKSGYLKNTIGGAILAVSMLFGIGIASSVTAQAQWSQNDQWRRDRAYEREQRRREREARREQRRRERTYGNWDYRNGDWNNRGGRAPDGYGNYGGSFDLRQTALNAGFADGYKEGRKDRDRNERFNYTDESGYQKATRDYSSSKGDRYTYQRYYREAFANGYADGYGGF
jgi:hypothetical protein